MYLPTSLLCNSKLVITECPGNMKRYFGLIFVLLTFYEICQAAPSVTVTCNLKPDGKWCCKCSQGGIGINVQNLQGFMLMCNAKKNLEFIKTFSAPAPSTHAQAKTTVSKPEIVHTPHHVSKPVQNNFVKVKKRVIFHRFRPELDRKNPGVKVIKVYKKGHAHRHSGIQRVVIAGKSFYGRFQPDGRFKIAPNYNPRLHRKHYKLEFAPKNDVIAKHMKDRDCFAHDIHLKNGQETKILGYIWVCRHGVLVRTKRRYMTYI